MYLEAIKTGDVSRKHYSQVPATAPANLQKNTPDPDGNLGVYH
jgi:hypothetical protein